MCVSLPGQSSNGSTVAVYPSDRSDFVLDHGTRTMFSQSYLCGVNLGVLPFIMSRSDDLVWDSMCSYVAREMEKLAVSPGGSDSSGSTFSHIKE